jgi:hypothetical protein
MICFGSLTLPNLRSVIAIGNIQVEDRLQAYKDIPIKESLQLRMGYLEMVNSLTPVKIIAVHYIPIEHIRVASAWKIRSEDMNLRNVAKRRGLGVGPCMTP